MISFAFPFCAMAALPLRWCLAPIIPAYRRMVVCPLGRRDGRPFRDPRFKVDWSERAAS
jgi:hypothetical protein